MLRQSENLVHRLFARQIARGSANNQGLRNRQLYENIVPSHTVYDVVCPDHVFRKFTNDGQYLVCFSRNLQDLVVYRHNWLTHCCKGADCDASDDLPPKSKKFESYFTQLYVVPLASGNDVICKDFFLTTENNLYGIFATTTGPDYSAPATRGSVPGVPSVEKISIHLVRLSDGVVVDERVFHDDYIQLSHNVGGMGVFLYDDLLVVLSIRFQCIYILQVREAGLLVDVRSIGAHCREDDELKINMQVQEEAWFQQQQAAVRKARGVQTESDAPQAHGEQQQKEGLPFCWNANSNLKSRSRQNGKIQVRGQPAASRTCHSPGGSHSIQEGTGGATPATPAGIYGGLQGADLDLQYDGYFRGLFTSLDNGHRQHNRAGAPGIRAGDPSSSQGSHSRQGNGFEAGPSQDSRGAAIRLSRAFSTYENVYGNQQRAHHNALASTSGSGSGGQQPGTGPPSWQNRSFSSASGESTDLLTSERTSYSYRASSTTLTSTTCSGSGSGSGSSKRDWSVTGGSASYGEVGGGSGSRNTVENNHVEYVVSSRTHRGRASGLTDMMEVDEAGPSVASGHLANGGHQLSTARTAVATAPPTFSGSRLVADGRGLARGLDMQNGSASAPVHDNITGAGPRVSLAAEGSRRAPISAHRPNVVPRSSGNMLRGGGLSNPPSSNGRPANVSLQDVNAGGVGPQADNGNNGRILDGVGQQGSLMLGGLKQRLLSFIFQGIWNDADPVQRANRLKRFYYYFQQYVDLVMWKVQFLDRYHLLIKFGSVDGVVQRTADNSTQNAFFAVYNLETTEILGFYQNSSEEFLLSYEHYCDHFRVVPSFPVSMSFVTSHSNNLHAREQFHKQKAALINSKIAMAQVVRKTLASLPFTSQSHSPSPYFDQALFHFDEKLISAIDRHRPCMEHPVKFISRRRPNSLKFKVNPGLELGSNDGRGKRLASFIFHPIYPFAISVQQAYLQPSIVNFHFRK